MAKSRVSPVEMTAEEFRESGHQLIELIGEFLQSIKHRPVTTSKSPSQIKKLLDHNHLPAKGTKAHDLLIKTSELLFEHSLLNGHPKFLGYITSSAAPIGALGELLAASVNPNVGANLLSPVATEIEKQTIQWLAEFIGLPSDYGGILVSGGNMANFTGFLAGRNEKSNGNFKEEGISNNSQRQIIYCSKTTHTWIEKAAILFGHGSNSIRWIRTDERNKMDLSILDETIQKDLSDGYQPIMVVGTAGDVSTGVVDNLSGIAIICKKYDLWFHIDGAYGAPAAGLSELKSTFAGIADADSIALDPHKWFYSPLEAGCTLVKNPRHLINAFSSHPDYYNFDGDGEEPMVNFYEYGLQNSRGFKALKVWLALQQVGSEGYQHSIREDIEIARYFFELSKSTEELEAVSHNLSITTLRYSPRGFEDQREYLNTLNENLLNTLQKSGEMFLSNAIINDNYCLRGCIVNFRTSKKDVDEMVNIILREGRRLHLSQMGEH